jgi:hypothetical protein
MCVKAPRKLGLCPYGADRVGQNVAQLNGKQLFINEKIDFFASQPLQGLGSVKNL